MFLLAFQKCLQTAELLVQVGLSSDSGQLLRLWHNRKRIQAYNRQFCVPEASVWSDLLTRAVIGCQISLSRLIWRIANSFVTHVRARNTDPIVSLMVRFGKHDHGSWFRRENSERSTAGTGLAFLPPPPSLSSPPLLVVAW